MKLKAWEEASIFIFIYSFFIFIFLLKKKGLKGKYRKHKNDKKVKCIIVLFIMKCVTRIYLIISIRFKRKSFSYSVSYTVALYEIVKLSSLRKDSKDKLIKTIFFNNH